MKHASIALLASGLLAACGGGGGGGGSTPSTPAPQPSPSVAATFTANITTGAAIYQMTVGPDSRIWFSEFEGNQVGATTTTGTVSQYSTGAASQPNAIVVGPDGNVWSSGYGGGIYKITPSGSVTSYTLSGGHVESMAVGSDGNLWFGDYGNDALGRVTTAGAVTEFPMPAGANPGAIASGPDGNLWVAGTPANVNTIYKYSTAGVLLGTYTSGLTSTAYTTFIIPASDGNMYFGEYLDSATTGDKLGRLSTNGTISEIGTIAHSSYPINAAIGKDGNVYFCEYNRTYLGKIVISSGTVSDAPIPGISSDTLSAIVNGPDDRLYIGGKQSIYALSY